MTPTYIAWGICLWLLYLGLAVTGHRGQPSTTSPELESSWKDTIAATALASFLVMTWPVTLSLALARELWSDP